MSKNKVIIDKEKCIGCGTCVALCPEYFSMEGDKAIVIKEEVENNECVSDSISSCPVSAISLKKI